MDEGAETAAAVSVPDEFAGVPAESTLAGVAIGEGIEVGFVAGFGIESLFQYGLDGAVLRIVVVQGTPAGGLETLGAVFPDQAQYPLHLADVVHDVVIEQGLDQGMAGTADFPCLRPAPKSTCPASPGSNVRCTVARGRSMHRSRTESVYRGVAPPVTVDALKGALDPW